MSFYDIIMLVVFLGAIWFGYWKGLAWQVASLAAIIASYFLSVKFREPVSRFISAEEPWNRIAAMLIVFLGTSLVIWTIYASVSKSLKKMELKGFDRQAGAILGAAKGALLCMVITMFSVSLLGDKAHDAIHNSRSGRYVVRGITQVSAIVPAEIAKYVQPHVEDFHNAIGHDGTLPLDQYPQYGNHDTHDHGTQDPSQVPSYRGQWQTPTTPSQAGNNGNPGFNWNWNGGQAGNSQQAGYQQNSSTNNPAPQNGINFNNGWPDVNFQVNSKEVFDAATEAARRKLFESQQQR